MDRLWCCSVSMRWNGVTVTKGTYPANKTFCTKTKTRKDTLSLEEVEEHHREQQGQRRQPSRRRAFRQRFVGDMFWSNFIAVLVIKLCLEWGRSCARVTRGVTRGVTRNPIEEQLNTGRRTSPSCSGWFFFLRFEFGLNLR